MAYASQRIYLLDIPLIVDTICEYLSLEDILHCRQVSTAWFTFFNPHRWKTVKFADLSEKYTIEILQDMPRVRVLTVDLQDPELLDNNPYASQCTHLIELKCTSFGYMRNTLCRPYNPRTNALFLLEINPKLKTLEIDKSAHAVFHYFVPRVITSLSRHSCLTTLRISGTYTDPAMDVLCHLPLSIQDVEMRLAFSWSPLIAPPDPNSSLAPVITPTTFEDRFKQGRLYTRLTRLHLYIRRTSGASFLPLLKLCPQVQDLYLPLSLVEGPIQYLATVLEHCPKLRFLGIREALWELHLNPEDDIALFRTLRRTFLSRISRLDLVVGESDNQGHDVLRELEELMGTTGQQQTPLLPNYPLEVLNLEYNDARWPVLDFGTRALASLPNLRQFSSTVNTLTKTPPFQQHPETVGIGQYLQNITLHHHDMDLFTRMGPTSTRWSRREQSKALSTNTPLRIHGYTQDWSNLRWELYHGEVSLQDLAESPIWLSHNLQLLRFRIVDDYERQWDAPAESKQCQISRVSKLVYRLFRRLHAHATRDPQTDTLALQLSLIWASPSFKFPLETGLQAMWAQGLFDKEDDDEEKEKEEPLPMTEADAAWMCLPWPTLAEVRQITHQQHLEQVASTCQREPPKPTQSQRSILSYSDQGWLHSCSDNGRCYHHDGCELDEDAACAQVDDFSLPWDRYMSFADMIPDNRPRLQRQLEELENQLWCTNTKKYRKFGAAHHRKRLSSWVEYER
ncbi:hypothetical protein BG006_010879 [Podila minutissima]|uniref:F-box domain-containing protein n=1 Tax=Podila minutissima TaxID=64525 RepID=A0A9P5SD61_9FUNG|nr:hypothetical protein BG006_010879 [Podila minutissima]